MLKPPLIGIPRTFRVAIPLALLASACAEGVGRPGTGSGGTPGTGAVTGSATGGSTVGGTGGTGGATAGSTGGRTGTGGAPIGGGVGGTAGPIMRVDLTGKKVLLIVGSSTSPSNGDIAFRALLADKGMVVTLTDGITLDPGATTMNLIVGSDTAGSEWAPLYKDVPVPIITFGNASGFALGYTATNSLKGSVSTPTLFTIVDENTPLAAAFTTGTNIKVVGTDRNTSYYWATPGGASINVASVMGAPTQLGVFAFEKGAMMAIGTAAARRVALGWRIDFVVADLAIEAFRMMNAAIEWTATAP